jgi:T5SS/PEP-CTERM-associated repeat protein
MTAVFSRMLRPRIFSRLLSTLFALCFVLLLAPPPAEVAAGLPTIDNETVIIDGQDVFVDTTLTVGNSGTGVLNIRNGGKVTVNDPNGAGIVLGKVAGSSGILNIGGGYPVGQLVPLNDLSSAEIIAW